MISDIKKDDSLPKILTIDIETSPNLGYFWGLFKQNIGISQIDMPGEVISFASKWIDSDDVIFKSVFHDGKEAMLDEAWMLLDEADIVVGYNQVSFDMKHLNREFVENQYLPTSRWKDVDLLKVVRSRFKFPSNKLDYVAQAFGLGGKVSHTGFDLWLKCMQNDPEAWELMKEYNCGDVTLTEQLYLELRPWILGHPHVGLFTGDDSCCPTCGSTDISPTGKLIVATTRSYSGFRCDSCGYVGKFSKSIESTKTT